MILVEVRKVAHTHINLLKIHKSPENQGGDDSNYPSCERSRKCQDVPFYTKSMGNLLVIIFSMYPQEGLLFVVRHYQHGSTQMLAVLQDMYIRNLIFSKSSCGQTRRQWQEPHRWWRAEPSCLSCTFRHRVKAGHPLEHLQLQHFSDTSKRSHIFSETRTKGRKLITEQKRVANEN